MDRKQSFLDQKIEVLTRARKWTFFKGVSPWILPKKRTFSYGRVSQKSYQKRLFFLSLFFTEIMSEKMIFRDFGFKTIIVRPKYKRFRKGEKVDIF